MISDANNGENLNLRQQAEIQANADKAGNLQTLSPEAAQQMLHELQVYLLQETGRMAKVGGWQFDVASQELVWTEAVYRIHEVELTYKPSVSKAIAFYTPTSRPIIEQAVQRAIEFGEPFELELEIITAKGNHRWVRAFGEAQQEAGKTRKVLGVFQDVTERKRAEEALQKAHRELEQRVAERTKELQQVNEKLIVEITERKQTETALRESEERYHGLFDQASEGLFIMTMDGQLSEVNQSFAEMHGYTVDGLKHMNIRELDVLKDKAIDDHAEFIRRIKAGEVVHFEVEHYHKDGHTFPLAVTSSMINLGGQPFFLAFHQNITERKQADEALRQSETLLRESQIIAGLGSYVLDVATGVWRSSEVLDKVLGIDKSYAHSVEGWLALIHPNDREMMLDHLKNDVLGQSQPFDKEYRIIRQDNQVERWVHGLGKLEFDVQGRPLKMYGTIQDIAERRQAQEALLEAEWKFRALFEQGPIGVAYHVMIYDAAGKPIDYRFLDANESYRELTGVDPRGKTVTQAFPGIEKDPFDWIGTFGRVARTGEPIRLEQYFQTNGRWYDCVGYQYKPDHFVAAFLEITKRKQAEEALRRNEARQGKMVANIGDVIVIIDQDGINRYKSPNIEKWFGWRSEEVVGANALENVHPEDLNHAQNFIGALFGKPNAAGTTECRYRCKDGRYKWIEFTGVNLLHDPDIRGLLGNYHDITERKRAEEEKAKLEAQLHQAQKIESVGRLAGGVAHDFNNMLQAILGNVDLALDGIPADHPMLESLKEIQNAAQRSANLTQQLLAFARRQTIVPRVLELNETVESLLKMLRRLIGEDIHLAWLPGAGLWPVNVDPTQIHQVLANLCVNARDAIGGVGKITIETENSVFDETYCADHPGYVAGEYVRLAVSDNGCGMGKETLAQIFEPFFTTKEVGEGTGLGLATVYGIVKQNNGFINVYSEPGRGTTFHIYLPRHAGQATTPQPQGVAKQLTSRGEMVLVVEDEQAILTIARRVLERLGYTVLIANTPGQAIRLAEEHAGKIHLLMTDVIMPEMNGRDLARRIFLLHPKLKCLYMSGYTADVIARHGVLEEGVHFIQKPFSLQDLAAKVRATLEL